MTVALVLLSALCAALSAVAAFLWAETRQTRQMLSEALTDVSQLDDWIAHARASVAAEKGESLDDMVQAWRIPSYHFHQRTEPK